MRECLWSRLSGLTWQNGLLRMPALRNRMNAPELMIPCRMPCDAINGGKQSVHVMCVYAACSPPWSSLPLCYRLQPAGNKPLSVHKTGRFSHFCTFLHQHEKLVVVFFCMAQTEGHRNKSRLESWSVHAQLTQVSQTPGTEYLPDRHPLPASD